MNGALKLPLLTTTAALALVSMIAFFAALESTFGLCVGCRAFYLGMRLGLVPSHVCEDCAPFLQQACSLIARPRRPPSRLPG